ncbi:MAG: TlpA family protein disulfide reductase [Pseudomonadales bacterium]|nr:TlpA family protein disulfide reductase [Pseudomonadales bacterium]
MTQMTTTIRKLLLITLLTLPSLAWGADLFIGDKAKNFTLKSNLGENLRLSEQRGQVILMTFWATWCGPCTQQLKDFETLYQTHKEKGFQVWAVGMDEDPKESAFHGQKLGLSFPILFDGKHEVAKAYMVDDLPTTVIVDRDGEIRFIQEDYRNKHLDTYKKKLNKIVNE